jgi:hypothetical protein
VPYQIDGAVFPTGSAGRQQVLLAINGWNTTSIVKLRQANPSDADFINITSSSDAKSCSSPTGRQGGSQPVACSASASAGVLMHEIGHALGLIHEHKRPDRNTFRHHQRRQHRAGQGRAVLSDRHHELPRRPL